MMSPEIHEIAPHRASTKDRLFRSFSAVVVGGSIMMVAHQDRECSESDFLQVPPSHAQTLELDNRILNPKVYNYTLNNEQQIIEGPKAPTIQEMLADISYQFDNAVRVHEEQLKVEGERKNQKIEKISPPVTDGQVTASSVGLASDRVWDKLAHCESTDDWSINTGNGYFGGLQMDMDFWNTYGGLEFAERPDLATKEQQITVAERGRDSGRGYGPWPGCSLRYGFR